MVQISVAELQEEISQLAVPVEVPRLERDEDNNWTLKGQKIFIRCFNRHVVVRVGGGWDTLLHVRPA